MLYEWPDCSSHKAENFSLRKCSKILRFSLKCGGMCLLGCFSCVFMCCVCCIFFLRLVWLERSVTFSVSQLKIHVSTQYGDTYTDRFQYRHILLPLLMWNTRGYCAWLTEWFRLRTEHSLSASRWSKWEVFKPIDVVISGCSQEKWNSFGFFVFDN